MPRTAISPRALRWLQKEIAYLAERNPVAASRVVDRIDAAREMLSAYPGLAQAGRMPGLRTYLVSPYILTLAERGGRLEIVTIRHARHARQGDARSPAVEADE